MTKIEIIKKVLLEIFYFIKAYFTNYLFPMLKEVFEETKQQFLKTLWEKIKADALKHAEKGIEEVNSYFNSVSYELKETLVIDYIFDRIELPLLLRPSKIIAKKMVKKKIREFIADKLEQLQKLNKVV